MFLKVHPDNPQDRYIQIIKNVFLSEVLNYYPTDTIYGLGCDIFQHKAIEKGYAGSNRLILTKPGYLCLFI
jgi:tRNA A37 threonylcarbamoyladenosine synthetase subunit TsaC/SUA5/YrdC